MHNKPITSSFSWILTLSFSLILIYFLSAPPVIIAAVRHGGEAAIPAIYKPVMRIIQSDFGGPMLWYFNHVWHADIVLIGDNDPTWPMTLLYLALAVTLLAVIFFPILKKLSSRLSRSNPSPKGLPITER
jgi:hypothetical protein